jgi:dGTPase
LRYTEWPIETLSVRIHQANTLLAPYATVHEGRMGRRMEEPGDETRFPFQRDRDRIFQATAFRRLQGKTQVFVSGEGDHFRTRLTHTMEVAQIGRDIARALQLNEDLTECIALAHDLGHPPFGHVGEEAIDGWMREHGMRFEHNNQSFRIVTILEKRSGKYPGLNLNREVEEGLLKHHDTHPHEGHALERTAEAELANIADEVAYTSHDCDDALMGEIFPLKELIKIPLAREAYDRSKKRGTYLRGSLVHLLVKDLLATSASLLEKNAEGPRIGFSDEMRSQIKELRTFLAERMYFHPRIRHKALEGHAILDLLCREYFDHPNQKILAIQERTECSLPEAVKDYVSGMTEGFAWSQAAELGLLPVVEPIIKKAEG